MNAKKSNFDDDGSGLKYIGMSRNPSVRHSTQWGSLTECFPRYIVGLEPAVRGLAISGLSSPAADLRGMAEVKEKLLMYQILSNFLTLFH